MPPDPATRFASRLSRAVGAAEAAGLDPSLLCNALAGQLVAVSMNRFGVKGARLGLQRVLIGLNKFDDGEEPPGRLGGVAYGERVVATGRRRF